MWDCDALSVLDDRRACEVAGCGLPEYVRSIRDVATQRAAGFCTFRGRVEDRTNAANTLADFMLSNQRAPDPTAWRGASGSALVHEDSNALVGVLVHADHSGYELIKGDLPRPLVAETIATFAKRADFRRVLSLQVVSRSDLQRRLDWETYGGDLGIALSYRNRLTEFREEYLVSERGRVPFGGRDAELDHLNQWLAEEQRPARLLMTAPAGRGKSALIVRWMEQLEAGTVSRKDGWRLAFVPISVRVETHLPERFYEGLALRLVEISDLPLDETRQRDAAYFKASVRKQLEHIASSGMKVLVVPDGIDEALEGSFDAAIVPRLVPPTLRVVISARTQVGDSEVDSRGWLKRLSWDGDTRVETMELEKLDAERIADVLVRLGAPMDVLAQDPEVTHRLAELTEGEPLLVRFYATDLWDRSLKGARITTADLDTLKPGFGSYFSRWLEHQERLWEEEDTDMSAERTECSRY